MSPRVYRLVITPDADADLVEAAGWYEGRRIGLGREFLRAFRTAAGRLRRNPLMYQIVVGDARRVMLERFPYAVIYEIHGSDVVILACMRETRAPEAWMSRLPKA